MSSVTDSNTDPDDSSDSDIFSGLPAWTATDAGADSGIKITAESSKEPLEFAANAHSTQATQAAEPSQSSSSSPAPPIVVTADSADAQADLDALKVVDPLVKRPRISAIVLCVVAALVCFAAAAVVYRLGVHTEIGQSYDDMVWHGLKDAVPGWFAAVSGFLSIRLVIPIICIAVAVLAFVIMVMRKRWWLIGQGLVFGVLCYGAAWLKHLLPRPKLIHLYSQSANSAPSGHTLLAIGASLVLLMAVPRAWRAVAALFGGVLTASVALSLVVCHWHRPTDVVMSILIGSGIAALTLAFTRSSGMDDPGRRISSASVQIVASVALTFGLMFMFYGAYVFWNILPGLSISAMWTQGGAYSSTVICVIGLTSFMFGLLLALRQLTASPLSKLGLVGAPPAPPVVE